RHRGSRLLSRESPAGHCLQYEGPGDKLCRGCHSSCHRTNRRRSFQALVNALGVPGHGARVAAPVRPCFRESLMPTKSSRRKRLMLGVLRLEDRTVPATSITIVSGSNGSGSLDSFLFDATP